MVNTQVEYWVLGVFSHFRFLCLFEEFIEDNISPLGWGTTTRCLRCQKGHVPEKYFGGGGPLPGPQGVRRVLYINYIALAIDPFFG